MLAYHIIGPAIRCYVMLGDASGCYQGRDTLLEEICHCPPTVEV